jgi:hypothetical protein
VRGVEPPTSGATVRCSNQLSYTHRMCVLACLGRVELPTYGLEVHPKQAAYFTMIGCSLAGNWKKSELCRMHVPLISRQFFRVKCAKTEANAFCEI